MVEPFNDQDELKSRLSFLGPNQDQWDLENRLLDATLEMESKIGRTVEEQLRPTREDQTDFALAFSNIHEVVRVEGFFGTFDEEVDSSNYTVTKEPTRADPTNISFDSTFADDNLHDNDYRLRVIYVPDLFKRLELRLAELDITTLASIQTSDDQIAAQAEKARERVESLMKSINRTTQNLNDSKAGDTLAANFNFPGNRR